MATWRISRVLVQWRGSIRAGRLSSSSPASRSSPSLAQLNSSRQGIKFSSALGSIPRPVSFPFSLPTSLLAPLRNPAARCSHLTSLIRLFGYPRWLQRSSRTECARLPNCSRHSSHSLQLRHWCRWTGSRASKLSHRLITPRIQSLIIFRRSSSNCLSPTPPSSSPSTRHSDSLLLRQLISPNSVLKSSIVRRQSCPQRKLLLILARYVTDQVNLNRTVFLRYAPEMQGLWNSQYGQRPTAFVASWRAIYTAIKAIAPLTILVWAPNTSQGLVHRNKRPPVRN